MIQYTIMSQITFLTQFIFAGILVIYEFNIYNREKLEVQKQLLLFLGVLSIGGLYSALFISDTGLLGSLVDIFSTISIAILLITALVMIERPKFIYPVIILAIISILATLNYAITGEQYLSYVLYRIIAGTISLLIVVPAIIIFLYYAYTLRDTTLSMFSLGLILFKLGGFGAEISEIVFASSFLLANICFILGVVLSKVFKVSESPKSAPSGI